MSPKIINLCRVLTAVTIVCAWFTSPSANAGEHRLPEMPVRELPMLFGGAFTLVDKDGNTRTDQDFRGTYMLINFGYSNCPNICPTDLTTISTAVDMLGHQGERVQPIFITVDPERDTPERLKEYLFNFHPRLIGMGGSEAQIRAVAKVYRVHRGKIILDDTSAENYLATHSSLTYLMGPDGAFLTLFPHDTAPQLMADALRRHFGG